MGLGCLVGFLEPGQSESAVPDQAGRPGNGKPDPGIMEKDEEVCQVFENLEKVSGNSGGRTNPDIVMWQWTLTGWGQ